MIKVIGANGASSFGYTPDTIPSYREALESSDGFLAPLIRSMDGDLFCAQESARNGEDHVYDFHRRLCQSSAKLLSQRKLQDCMGREISGLFLNNGEAIPRLHDIWPLQATYNQAEIFLDLRGEGTESAILKKLQSSDSKAQPVFDRLVISAYNSSYLGRIRSLFQSLKTCFFMMPENFSRGVRLYPCSVRDFSCYVPFSNSVLESPLTKRASPDLFGLEISSIRENTIRKLSRLYPESRILIWQDKEPRPKENVALRQRLQNALISPAIYGILTKYPRQMSETLQQEFKIPEFA